MKQTQQAAAKSRLAALALVLPLPKGPFFVRRRRQADDMRIDMGEGQSIRISALPSSTAMHKVPGPVPYQ